MFVIEVKIVYVVGKFVIGCGFEFDWLRERNDFFGLIIIIFSEEKLK